MTRLKRALASIFVILGITVGTVVVAPVATAAPAHAVTMTQCSSYYQYGWNYVTVCYYDYNWWEEVVLGHHDGWYKVNTTSA